eukprot:ANDGO_01719.mRNA.1 hypothetical protein
MNAKFLQWSEFVIHKYQVHVIRWKAALQKVHSAAKPLHDFQVMLNTAGIEWEKNPRVRFQYYRFVGVRLCFGVEFV